MNEQSPATPLPSTLQDRLSQGRFVMTAELAPPVSCDADELLRKAAALKGLADAVNVTDGAGARAHMAALAAARLLIDVGIAIERPRHGAGRQADGPGEMREVQRYFSPGRRHSRQH